MSVAFSNQIGSRDRRPLCWRAGELPVGGSLRLLRLSVLASGSSCVFLWSVPDIFRDLLCHPILSFVFSSCEVEGNS